MVQSMNKPEAAGAQSAAAEAQMKSAKNAVKTATKEAEATAQTASNEAEATAARLEAGVPEAFRSMAEKAVNQSRQAYDKAKDSLEQTVETLERSLDKAGQGAAEINRKVIDIAQTNVNTSFDLAKDLAGARNLAEVFELQTAFARKQFQTMVAQAEEIRALSTRVATESTEPFKTHMSRSMEMLRWASNSDGSRTRL